MKNVPEIAPEIRGLLEEIVADPRSMIRLAPRRALRTWFDTGETVRASDIVRTSAERHLVEVHREALAALLCEASWISYWKAPVLAHRPLGPDGELYSPTDREPNWRLRSKKAIHSASGSLPGVDLLRQCLEGVKPDHGCALAAASLGLVPRDLARYYFALSVPWSKPSVAISLLNRFARIARPATTRLDALLSLASRTCSLGLLREGRELYREASALSPKAPYGPICSFNLSCFLGEGATAEKEALQLGSVVGPHDPALIEELELFKTWAKSRTEAEISKAKRVRESISSRIPEVAVMVCQTFES